MVAFSIRRPAVLLVAAGAAAASMAVAGGAQAALVIDDFTNQGTFGAVISDAQTPSEHGISAYYATTHALGGERDAFTRIDNPVAYPGDNAYGEIVMGGGTYFGQNTLSVSIGYGAVADFRLQYDGVDGSMNVASPGLGLNAAAAGDHITLTGYRNAFLGANGAIPTDLTVTLTDSAGRSASLSRTLAAGLNGVQALSYGFADFAALNSNLNFGAIAAIELSGTLSMGSFLTGDLEVGGFGIDGAAYVQTGGPTQGAGGPVPEPGAWALMLAGFGLAGAALRRARGAAALA